MNVSGVFPALTTPFDADGAVSVEGIKHNIAMHLRILRSDAFRRGDLDTGALERGTFG